MCHQIELCFSYCIHFQNAFQCFRFDSTTWYVWHKNTFVLSDDDNVEMRIPQYSNVYKIESNSSFTECKCDNACKFTARTGMPCVHILRVLNGICHPMMFHPRYLKVYNDLSVSSNPQIQNILNEMVSWKRGNPRQCRIYGLLPDDQINTTSHVSVENEEIVKVLSLVEMDADQKVYLKGEPIPVTYIERAKTKIRSITSTEMRSITDIDYETCNFDDSCNFDVENLSVHSDQSLESVLNNNDTIENKEEYTYGTLKRYLDIYVKEMDKVLKGHPKSWPLVKEKMDAVLAWQTQQANDSVKNHSSPSQKLVSSNGPIERSPYGKRYKSFYEHF